jgi:hypothetical protein
MRHRITTCSPGAKGLGAPIDGGLEHTHSAEAAIGLRIIKAVTHHKIVGDIKPQVVDGHIDLHSLGLAQQRGNPDRGRLSTVEVLQQPGQGQPESTMSSTMMTWRPSREISRSFTILTTPLDLVEAP